MTQSRIQIIYFVSCLLVLGCWAVGHIASQDLSAYEALKDPRISSKPHQKMLGRRGGTPMSSHSKLSPNFSVHSSRYRE